MGSIGANRGSAGTSNITNDINSFITELENREYGSSTKLVPEKQQREYRALKREIIDHINTWGIPDNYVVFASGFTNSDEYVHTNAKLNQYQRMVRSDVKNIKTDLSIGVITPEEAAKELFVVKSIDATIKNRRKILKEWA